MTFLRTFTARIRSSTVASIRYKLLWFLTALLAATALSAAGELAALCLAVVLLSTVIATISRQPIVAGFRFVARSGGWKKLLLISGCLVALSLLLHGQPAHAIFDGAKQAAQNGIGSYIGQDESTNLIDVLLFALWALAAVGGLAAVAGGVLQQIQVLVGGLLLFFGMAVLIGILEFTDNIIFAS